MSFNLKLKLASQYARFISPQKIVMVSGSAGKSNTIEACQAVLQSLGPVFSSRNSVILNPQLLFKLGSHKKGLFKTSLEQAGDAKLNLSLIRGASLIVTNIMEDGTLPPEQLMAEYSDLLAGLPENGSVILNYDDPVSRKLASKAVCEVIFYGTDQKNCHLWAGNMQISKFRVIFELNYGVERVEISTNFVSKAQIYPILAAAALGVKEGLRLTQIKTCLEKVYPPDHKMEVKFGYSGSTIIDDSFDGALSTMEDAVDSLNYIQARRRIVVLGPMKNSGLAENWYRRVAQKIYQDHIDLVYLAKGETEFVADELLKLGFIAGRLEYDLLNPQIVGGLLKVLAKGDVVLVKGAKEVRLDEVVAKITRK